MLTLARCRRPCRAAAVEPSPVTSRRQATVSASASLGKGVACAGWGRSRAPRRRVVLAGAPPPRLLAVRRVEPSSPLLEDVVVFTVRLPSSW
jgi:hypothetical protein